MNTNYVFMLLIFLLFLSCSNEPTLLKLKPEKLYPISVNEKWGFIDISGNVVIKPQFDYVGVFIEDLAPILINEKWGYINKFAEIVIPPKYDLAGHFEKGLAIVSLNDKYYSI